MKTNLNGVEVTRFDSYDEITQKVFGLKKIFIAINPEKIYRPDEWLKALVKNNIGYVDGVGVLFGLWKKGVFQRRRLPGFKLWLKVIEKKPKAGYFLLGGTEDVINKTVLKLEKEFKDINITGYRSGYFSDDEINQIISQLKKSKSRVIFVAMGSPKQEKIMKILHESYPASYIGLGGSFDYYIEKVKTTPEWIQKIGFQWIHRSIHEPKRFKRQKIFFSYMINLIFKY